MKLYRAYTVNGATKYVERNTAIYPFTPSGDAAMDNAVVNGNGSNLIAIPLSALVGEKFSNLTNLGSDYDGKVIENYSAPVLIIPNKNSPRVNGNYFNFPVQQAKNAPILKRIPEFTSHPDKLLTYSDLYYTENSNTAIQARGWNTIAESGQDFQTNTGGFKLNLNLDGYGEALSAANSLPSNDARKQWLMGYAKRIIDGSQPYIIDDRPSCNLLGRTIFNAISNRPNGEVKALSLDFEAAIPNRNNNSYPMTSNNNEQQLHNFIGWTYEGIRLEATTQGKPYPMFTAYDLGYILSLNFADFQAPAAFTYDGTAVPNSDVTRPIYMHYFGLADLVRGNSVQNPMSKNHIFVEEIIKSKGALGLTSYIKYTWDDTSLFEKNTDGTYRTEVKGGKPCLVYKTDGNGRNTTINGFNTVIAPSSITGTPESFYVLFQSVYQRLAANMAAIYFRSGGKDLPNYKDRQQGFEDLKIESWNRLNTEAGNNLPDNPYNSRPINADYAELDAIHSYLFNDVVRSFQTPYGSIGINSRPSQNIGTIVKANGSSYPDFTCSSIAEIYTKGNYRASELNWIFDANYKLIQPKHWLFKQGTILNNSPFDPMEDFPRKPIITGGLATKNNLPAIWLLWCYPAQDVDKVTEVSVWIDQNGIQTPAYIIKMVGRKTGLDWWFLPQSFVNVQPEQVRIQFKDMLGDTQTWTGDYRVQLQSNPIVPQKANYFDSVSDTLTQNYPPVLVYGIPQQTFVTGQYFTYTIPLNTFSDPQNSQLNYTASNLPNGLTITPQGVISGTSSDVTKTVTIITTNSFNLSTGTTFILSASSGQTILFSKVGYRYDAISHGFKVFVQLKSGTTGLFQVAIVQAGSSGSNWVNNQFLALSNDTSVATYSLSTVFLPLSLGQGGVLEQPITITLRKSDGTNSINTFTFNPVNTPSFIPTEIALSGGSSGCTDTSANWVNNSITKCTGTTLERQQTDQNICSTSYNTNRYIVEQTNSSSCVNQTNQKFYGFDYAIPSNTSATNRPSNNKAILSQNGIKVERWFDYGGAICHVSQNNGPNMINNHDKGRQLTLALYGGSRNFAPPGFVGGGPNVNPNDVNTYGSYNPLEPGDWAGNPSEIIAYGFENGTHYLKVRANSFFLTGYVTGTYFESWMRFLPGTNIVRVWYRITIDRTQDNNGNITSLNTDKYPGFHQEFPTAYIHDLFRRAAYHDGTNVVYRDLTNIGFGDLQGVPIGENWIAIDNGSGSGFGIHGPDIWSITGRTDGDGAGGEFGSKATYLSNDILGMQMDTQGVIYTVYDIIVGDTNTVRTWANNNTDSRINNNIPNYNFLEGRHNFYVHNATISNENAQGGAIVTLGTEQSRFISPMATFEASSIPTVFIKMSNSATSGELTTLRFKWRLPGQKNHPGASQEIDFTVPNDGITRVIPITPNWTGKINFFQIEKRCPNSGVPGQGCRENINATGTWKFDYIGKNSPNI